MLTEGHNKTKQHGSINSRIFCLSAKLLKQRKAFETEAGAGAGAGAVAVAEVE